MTLSNLNHCFSFIILLVNIMFTSYLYYNLACLHNVRNRFNTKFYNSKLSNKY